MLNPADSYKSLTLQAAMTLVKEASLLASIPTTETEIIPITAARGRVVTENIVSPLNIPNSTNSAMDGFAVYSGEKNQHASSTQFMIQDTLFAGDSRQLVRKPRHAIRIMTGGIVPQQVDLIVPLEFVTLETSTNSVLIANKYLKAGYNIRNRGESVQQGDTIITAGTKLQPQTIAMLASVGIASVRVFRRLRVGVFATGTELKNPGSRIATGEVFDSNRFFLIALLEALGVAVTDLGIIADDLSTMQQVIADAACNHDVLITSGGVSSGDKDYVPTIAAHIGRIIFWRIKVKPGRPLLFARIHKALLFALPGNPVATAVVFLRFVYPSLCAAMGSHWYDATSYQLPACFAREKRPGRTEWLRVKRTCVNGVDMLDHYQHDGSGIFHSIVRADGLAEIPALIEQIQVGDSLCFIPFDQYGIY